MPVLSLLKSLQKIGFLQHWVSRWETDEIVKTVEEAVDGHANISFFPNSFRMFLVIT